MHLKDVIAIKARDMRHLFSEKAYSKEVSYAITNRGTS